MRLGRLVAAGLVVGLAAGFVGALLRPRTVPAYGQGSADSPGAPPDHAVAAAATARGATH